MMTSLSKPLPLREGVGDGCTTLVGKRLTAIARKLRGDMTHAERRLWSHLRASQLDGIKFIRQHPIGDFVVDFACRSARLAVELDGGQHADDLADDGRTKIIEAHGYRVIRFWNHDVLQNTDGVLTAISEELNLARNRP